uniref:2-hydroxyflavanone C-glucosyltransferase n=1 Tax=Dianthus caryophyllus TaxID=3570 RepID=Q60FF2_DIACA|nr:UDP-glucose:flavonoid 3-O-glucosyltransferase [Dianthus caryophyllus]
MSANSNYMNKSRLHVAVFPFPFGTHATPLFNITQKLASFMPDVVFSFFNIPQSNAKISSDFKNDTINMYDVWDGVPEGYVFKGKPQEDIELFMLAAPPTLTEALAKAEVETGTKVSCILGDAFLWFLEELAQQKQVPWITTYMSEEHSLLAHICTDLIRQTIGIHEKAEERKDEELDFIPGLSKIRVQDLPEGIVMGNLDSYFARMLHQMGRALPRASAVCISSCQELDPVATNELNRKLNKLINVGPLSLITQSNSLPSGTNKSLGWLDKQESENSVAYVSFGSVARPDATEITALAQALEASQVKFIWSIRDNLKVHLPGGFIENTKDKGMVVSWVPQTAVLAHKAVGVFITHFGHNSIMESIASEVPMIGRPFIGEQKLNGRIVEAKWCIGLVVEGGVFTKDGVLRSLNKILGSTQGEEMRRNIRDLRLMVDKALSPDGSCNTNLKHLVDMIVTSN